MEPYKPGDFCKSIDCDYSDKDYCKNCCKVYIFHQYLREHGQILEEGSELEDHLIKPIVYCDAHHCKFGRMGTTGDGYHEPILPDFSCSKDNELDKLGYTDFEEDDTLPICPMFRCDFAKEDELEKLRGEGSCFDELKQICNQPHPCDFLRKELEQLRKELEVEQKVIAMIGNWVDDLDPGDYECPKWCSCWEENPCSFQLEWSARKQIQTPEEVQAWLERVNGTDVGDKR